jgi:hypothetical protein
MKSGDYKQRPKKTGHDPFGRKYLYRGGRDGGPIKMHKKGEWMWNK